MPHAQAYEPILKMIVILSKLEIGTKFLTGVVRESQEGDVKLATSILDKKVQLQMEGHPNLEILV